MTLWFLCTDTQHDDLTYLMMIMERHKLFSVREAAEYLNIAEWTLRSWISQKRIPYVKLGSRTLFDINDLNKWIESHKVEAVEFDN